MVMDIFRNSLEQPSDSLAKSASCKDPILPQLGLHSMLLIQFLLIEDAQNLFMRKDASNSYSRDGKAKGRSGQLAYSRH